MGKEVMRRTAGDNEYLHKDFHGALSVGIEYLDKNYGEDAVREYLRQFTASFYAPLVQDINERGLVALKEHFGKLYEVEGGDVRITLSDDELRIEVDACPAVAHMKEHGRLIARLFCETTKTVNESFCKDSPFDAELIDYDPETGRNVQRFYRRTA